MAKVQKNWTTKDMWYAAVAGGGIIALFIGLMFFAAIRATASELVHDFHSPSFSGVGWSTHMLSIEQLQHNRKEDIRDRAEGRERQEERDENNKTINKFIKNVESRIYANLSKQLVDNMFATCADDDTDCTTPLTGTADIEGSVLVWTKDPDLGTITLVITDSDCTTSTMVVPVGDFGF